MKTVWIPEKLRPPIEPEIIAVDILLRDGRIVRDVAYNRKGVLEGLVVGGQEGIREMEFEFDKSSVLKIKKQGTWGTLPFIRSVKDALNIL